MKIILDAMGGDNAPAETVKGAFEAANEYDLNIIITGDEQTISDVISENGLKDEKGNIEIRHAPQAITMEDAPLCVVREKRDSSMTLGLHMLHEGEGDAFVSAGNTGALHTGSTLIVRRIKGVKKSAIGTVLPLENPTLLLDSGANIEVNTETLCQFAKMGSVYMHKIFGIENPRVGLLNIGTESTKGLELHRETYAALSELEGINFVGNIEGRNIPYGDCDVLVTDGFTGNIVLKYTEGLCLFLMKKIKDVCTKNILSKISAAGLSGGMKQLKNEFDASEYGGAPLLGLTKPVIKAHGSSDAQAVKHAIKQAAFCVNSSVSAEIARELKIIQPNDKKEENIQIKP